MMTAHLLNHTASIHLRGQYQDMVPHTVGQHLFLGLVAMLEQFLNDVVSKDVGHELDAIVVNLFEDLFLFIAIGCL